MAPMDAALKTFFSAPRFAVAGASSNPVKFGHKGETSSAPSVMESKETSKRA
ncbi:hypothetical protein FH972_023833 [Carpinus fangiana]|uniref:Uncharacterized protein n=1 Tax=Carpinus fangiana TaxID=176857 RepID=A0A5N6KYU0_9ROSI|nr:hypothetical protein FH972_023833 [Carpinus fangiana]